jgi:16S rRNA (uracil1498-N3)-methyltransferase
MARFFIDQNLAAGLGLDLPPAAARHVQVLRLQPGEPITLFNGQGGQWGARIERMGRASVHVSVHTFEAAGPDVARQVHLALGMPANERMDWLVEKASELGAASIWPLQTSRSVLRLSGERALKKRAHWLAVARAACEQCGGNRVPDIGPIGELPAWLADADGHAKAGLLRCVLSLAADAQPLAQWLHHTPARTAVQFLSGPEGGLSPAEEDAARQAGYAPVSLGPRVLRAETAALAALTLALQPPSA